MNYTEEKFEKKVPFTPDDWGSDKPENKSSTLDHIADFGEMVKDIREKILQGIGSGIGIIYMNTVGRKQMKELEEWFDNMEDGI